MVAKKRSAKLTKRGRVSVSKLKLNKETVKDLSGTEKRGVKGGMARATGTCGDYPRTVQTACTCA
jgi:hypothetical protein